MTFVLSEILPRALTLMNSPQQRGRRAHAETPRRLRRVVLTCRPECRSPNRLIFRKRAEAARDLVWMMMGWTLDDPAAPPPRADRLGRGELHSSSISTEVARNFGGDARRFFEVTTKPRGKSADSALNIASIDVGGGNRPDHQYLPAGRRRYLGHAVPRAEDSARLQRGGRRHSAARRCGAMSCQVETALRGCGIANPDDLMAELVGGDRGGEDVIQRNLRQHRPRSPIRSRSS